MRKVTLAMIYQHPIAQKYLTRAGLDHAISTARSAFEYAIDHDIDPGLATKAAFLHDIGHYTWYRDGKWAYDLYEENDIHAIKGAERAHKLLIRLGEDRKAAKEIALAVLLHTDSYLPTKGLNLEPLQHVVALADEANEEPDGRHHYRKITEEKALRLLEQLDDNVEQAMQKQLEIKSS